MGKRINLRDTEKKNKLMTTHESVTTGVGESGKGGVRSDLKVKRQRESSQWIIRRLCYLLQAREPRRCLGLGVCEKGLVQPYSI